MERSKEPRGVFKGRYVDNRTERNRLRFPDTQSALEYEDSFEPSVRYVDSIKAVRSLNRERAQLRRLGKETGICEETGLQEDLAVDDEQK